MRKLTSLLMLLCVFVGTAWAEVESGRSYYLKVSGQDLYVDVRTPKSDNYSSTVAVSATPVPAFFEKQGEGWLISAAPSSNYLGVARWCACPLQDAENAKVWTIAKVEDAESYILSQSEYKGNNDDTRVYLGNTTAISEGTKLFTDVNSEQALKIEFVESNEVVKFHLQNRIDEFEATVGKVALQTTDAESPFYLSATLHGDATVDKMIDGKTDTYYGSTWGSEVGHRHYWQIDLVDATLPEFTFGYVTRANGSDTPTQIDIKGSKDGEAFVDIVSLTRDGNALPTEGGLSYKSATISNSEGYRYIRFEVPSTTNNYSYPEKPEQEVTIALAEFSMNKTEDYYSEIDKAKKNAIDKAKTVLNNDEATQDEVEEAYEALISSLQCTVKYSLVLNGQLRGTQETIVNVGDQYPEISFTFPYGITATKPSGIVDADNGGKVIEKEIVLTTEKELPFETAASAGEITKWYYMRMHTNQPGFIGDIADDNTINVAWKKTAEESTLDNFLWGFVGSDAFGITVVNKGTGKQLTSTGDGNATLTDAGTSFFVANTGETTYKAQNGFCLRKSDSNNYLNANYKDAKLSHWSSTDAGSTIFLYEEGTSANVTVSDAGYATVCIDYPVSIPEDVEVYTVTAVEGSSAKMTKVEGVLPENAGVIVKAAAGNYDFAISALPVASTSNNNLVGTVVDTDVTAAQGKAYYVLSNQEDGVGFYKAALADGKFKNNANKAYLPVTLQTESAARFLSFDFGTETAIESIEGAENAANAVIYDLSGRRVQKAQKGLYIVNGKKVIK